RRSPRLLLPDADRRGGRPRRGARVSRARLHAARKRPRRAGRPVPEGLRLPGRPGTSRRPRGDLAVRPHRAGHSGAPGAGAPRRAGAPLGQAAPQAGAHRMNSVNGVDAELNATQSGEVIESSTTEFLAQARELDAAPPFGAFVQIATDDGLTIVGVVAHVQTAG